MSSGAIVALVIACVIGALGLLAVIGIVVGSGNDSTVSRPDTPDGFTRLEGDGVSIAAPDSWQILDAKDASMTSDELGEAFPDAAPEVIEQGSSVLEQGAVLVAYDFSGGEFASNINILSIAGEAPLSDIERGAADEFGSLGGDVVDSGVVDLPVGDALRLEYTLPVALPDGSSQPTSGVQHYVPIDGRTYIITVSTGGDAAELADVMIDTFRVD